MKEGMNEHLLHLVKSQHRGRCFYTHFHTPPDCSYHRARLTSPDESPAASGVTGTEQSQDRKPRPGIREKPWGLHVEEFC